jgi:hypothetical protein
MSALARSLSSDLVQLVAHRPVDEDLLSVLLDLFDGNDITATFRQNRNGFYKTRGLPRRLAFKAHLTGVALVGAYPFRGVFLRCGCPDNEHTCEGAGTRYLCIDLDAKNGEQDTHIRAGAVVGVCRRFRLLPVVFTSRSGRGAHVFVFLDRRVTTEVAHVAGRAIAMEAGVHDRCDVIPSAGHAKGFGTLHALPLSPLTTSCGGGILISTSEFKPERNVLQALRWADSWRSSAEVVEQLTRQRVEDVARPAPVKVVRKRRRRRLGNLGMVIASIKAHHPQFRKALDTPPGKWRGGRSSRDAYLVGYLRRQGLTPEEAAKALVSLPETKTTERGMDYALALARAQDDQGMVVSVPLAGTPIPPQSDTQREPPWENTLPPRVAPPRSYGPRPNPWWSDSVQRRLQEQRSRHDAVVLAYIVDRYFRGPITRRMFFASHRELGEELRLTARIAGCAVKRLSKAFPDVIRVVPGVRHPFLRLATAFYVVDPEHRDRLNWYVGPGRSD